jgi:hypothetical protein
MTPKQRAIREQLRLVEEQHGQLDIDRIIEIARSDPNNPMHSEFTWDVQEAARKRWRDECRAMIRSVCYVEKTTRHEMVDVPEYVSVTVRSKERAYVSLDRVRENEILSQQTFNDEISRAIANVKRALAVSDVLGMRHHMEDVLSRLLQARERMAA